MTISVGWNRDDKSHIKGRRQDVKAETRKQELVQCSSLPYDARTTRTGEVLEDESDLTWRHFLHNLMEASLEFGDLSIGQSELHYALLHQTNPVGSDISRLITLVGKQLANLTTYCASLAQQILIASCLLASWLDC